MTDDPRAERRSVAIVALLEHLRQEVPTVPPAFRAEVLRRLDQLGAFDSPRSQR